MEQHPPPQHDPASPHDPAQPAAQPQQPQSQQPQPQPAAPQQPSAAQPQQPVWARPQTTVIWKETAPLGYHQLLRGVARYRWWKPLVALVLALIYYLTLSVLFLLPIGVFVGVTQAGEISPTGLDTLAVIDTQNPLSVLLALGSISLMIPAVWLAMLSAGLRPFGRVWSVALRIRWRWIGRTIVPAFVALLVINGVAIGVGMLLSATSASAEPAATGPDIDFTLALWSLAIVLVLVPIQATAEEVVYRGVFMQSLGAWLGGVRGHGGGARLLRGPWIPILLPAVLFGFSHIYDLWGFLAVTAMAVAAGWLCWRTGGLEAAISLHVINNLVAFSFMAFALGGETAQTASSGGPELFIGEVVGLLLFCWWVDRDFTRRDGRRTRIDMVQARIPVAQAPAPALPPRPPTTPEDRSA